MREEDYVHSGDRRIHLEKSDPVPVACDRVHHVLAHYGHNLHHDYFVVAYSAEDAVELVVNWMERQPQPEDFTVKQYVFTVAD